MLGDMRRFAPQSSPLLALPPELRNQIYSLAFANGPIKLKQSQRELRELVDRMQPLHVCHQIRAEAQQLFWSTTTFHCELHGRKITTFPWLKKIGRSRACMIASLVLTVEEIEHLSAIDDYCKDDISILDVKEAVRGLLRLGISASAIDVTESVSPGPHASGLEQANARKHEIFNEAVLGDVRAASDGETPQVEIQRRWDVHVHGFGNVKLYVFS